MHEPITPEVQRAWDNYQLALMAHRDARPLDLGTDATHAIGVNLADDTLATPVTPAKVVYLARPKRPTVREFARNILVDLHRELDHPMLSTPFAYRPNARHARLVVDRAAGFGLKRGPNSRDWHAYHVGLWLIVLHGSLLDALSNALAGRLVELDDTGAEFVAYASSAGLTWRGHVAFRVLCIKHAATRFALRAIGEGGAQSWR
jgi:hypothetical protein